MGRVGSPYEVRCLRCDVSFPPEARRCLHCGGPTSPSGAVANPSVFTAPPVPADRTSSAPDALNAPDAPDAAMPAPDGESPSVGATLFRSLGSVFWIVALVVISIVRSCGEG